MWYRMSRSRRGVLLALAVVAGFLLALSIALAEPQNQSDTERAKKDQQAQPAPNGRGQPTPGPVAAGRQDDRKAPEAPAPARGAPLPQPQNSTPAANPWQRGGWGRDRSASEPSGNRPVWTPPVARQPEVTPPGNNSSGGRWTYRPSEQAQPQKATPYRPARSQPDPNLGRQPTDRTQESPASPAWRTGARRASTPTLPAQQTKPGQNTGLGRVTIPEKPSQTRDKGTERLRQPAENSSRPAPRQGTEGPTTPRVKQPQTPIPAANFRGPQAEQNITGLPKGEGERVKRDLRDQLRQFNVRPAKPAPRPVRDVVGNQIAANVQFMSRSRTTYINVSYQNVYVNLGEPTHNYLFRPRNSHAYWDGYWDGYADGYWASEHLYHHPVVVLNFYYPYYYSDPNWVAFWYADLYPSVYHYWGWCPGWVYPQRVYYAPVDYTYVPRTPYRYYYTGYHLDEAGAEQAIGDISQSWLNSDIDLLAYHLTDQQDIQVYFDGEYEYTTSTEDYYGMTADTMATTHTVALDFDWPIWISTNEVFVTGRHEFYDPEGGRNTVYVSYRLRHLGNEWYLVAVGSSLEPIRHHYEDFRYS